MGQWRYRRGGAAIPYGRYTQVLEGHGLLTEDCHKSNAYKYHPQRTGWGLISLNYCPQQTSNPTPVPLPQVPLPLSKWSTGINFPAGINQSIEAPPSVRPVFSFELLGDTNTCGNRSGPDSILNGENPQVCSSYLTFNLSKKILI